MKLVSVPDSISSPSSELDLEEIFTDERWCALGDMIPDGLILVDRRGTVRYMNSAAESINEVVRKLVVDRPLSDLVKQTRLDLAVLPDAFASGGRINQVVADASGRSFAITTRCYRQWNSETNCFLIVLRNLEALARIVDPGRETPGLAFVPAPDTAP